jgi:hypothetical protein
LGSDILEIDGCVAEKLKAALRKYESPNNSTLLHFWK